MVVVLVDKHGVGYALKVGRMPSHRKPQRPEPSVELIPPSEAPGRRQPETVVSFKEMALQKGILSLLFFSHRKARWGNQDFGSTRGKMGIVFQSRARTGPGHAGQSYILTMPSQNWVTVRYGWLRGREVPTFRAATAWRRNRHPCRPDRRVTIVAAQIFRDPPTIKSWQSQVMKTHRH